MLAAGDVSILHGNSRSRPSPGLSTGESDHPRFADLNPSRESQLEVNRVLGALQLDRFDTYKPSVTVASEG
jgi:hypothetical protein